MRTRQFTEGRRRTPDCGWCRQGLGGNGAGGRTALVRPARWAGRDALRPRRDVRTHRNCRSRPPGAGCGGRIGRPAYSGQGAKPERKRPRAGADFRRRFSLAGGAGRGGEPGGKASHHRRSAQIRGQHQRDQLRAQTSLGHQGRPSGGGRLAGFNADAGDFRCAGRRSGGDCLRPDRG